MLKLLSAAILASASVSAFADSGNFFTPVSEPETMALFAVAAVAVAAVRYFKK